jgi:ABC-type sulfate transport system permease subunit
MPVLLSVHIVVTNANVLGGFVAAKVLEATLKGECRPLHVEQRAANRPTR